MVDSLELIASEVRSCTRCRLFKQANQAVPGEGPDNAPIFFIGQAPGANEDCHGRPFIGRAGKFLDKLLSEIGVKREQVFLTGAVKHFPPANRSPKVDELNACSPFLVRQLELVNPKIVVLMGRSAESVLHHPVLKDKAVVVTVHPSAAMRFPKMRLKMKDDFQKLKQVIGEKLL